MKLGKVLGAVLVSGVMVFSLSALAGCGTNSEELIRDSLTEEIDQIKNMDEESLAEAASALPAGTLSMLGLSSDEIIKSAFSGFDGTVDSVTVDGDTAQAVVTITSKNLSNMEDEMMSLVDQVTEDPSLVEGMTTDEIYQWCGQRLMEYIDNAPVETHEPITLDYELNGNTWQPTAASASKLESAVFGG